MNGKQQLFAEHYIKLQDATKAAIAAGYSARTAGSQGHRLLKNVEVSAYVRERVDAALRRVKMEADEVLERLSEHARGNIGDFIHVDKETGEPSLDLRGEQKPIHLLRKIKTKRTVTTTGDTQTAVTETEFELYSAQDALIALGRHHKLFTDKIQTDDWRRELELLGHNPDDMREKFVRFLEQELAGGEDD